MKQIYLAGTGLFFLFLFSFAMCNKDPETLKIKACFDYSPKSNINTGVELSFTNCSQNASSYLWIFGDAISSQSETPKHIYNSAGRYKVILLAQDHAITDVNADGKIGLADATQPKDTISTWIVVK